eukprot:1567798-Pyramimonas_sp.AAC.1
MFPTRGFEASLKGSGGSPRGSRGCPWVSGVSPRGCGAYPEGFWPPGRCDPWKAWARRLRTRCDMCAGVVEEPRMMDARCV